jgi:hypothetical protein
MERGLLVELSPNEETALQRIAQGVMLTVDMEPHHLVRLQQLALIEATGTDFRLTDLGRQRLAICGEHRQSQIEGQRSISRISVPLLSVTFIPSRHSARKHFSAAKDSPRVQHLRTTVAPSRGSFASTKTTTDSTKPATG